MEERDRFLEQSTETTKADEEEINGEGTYKIEKILGVRKNKNRFEYQIKWIGCEECSWEPKKHLNAEACEFSKINLSFY